MHDLLSEWIIRYRQDLEAQGLAVTLHELHVGGSRGVDLDSDLVVGPITHWPSDRFEVQFNSCADGEVLVLEERSFSSVEELNAFFQDLSKKGFRNDL